MPVLCCLLSQANGTHTPCIDGQRTFVQLNSGDVVTEKVAMPAHRTGQGTIVHDVTISVGDLGNGPSSSLSRRLSMHLRECTSDLPLRRRNPRGARCRPQSSGRGSDQPARRSTADGGDHQADRLGGGEQRPITGDEDEVSFDHLQCGSEVDCVEGPQRLRLG